MNVINSPFLRTTRDFPEDNQAMRMELIKMYIDMANATNARTVGLFPTNKPAINGEEWFITGQKNQGLRQLYTFKSSDFMAGVANIPHGINLANIRGFVRIFGTFTNGTNWYPLPYVDVLSATNQVNVIVDPINIVITIGAGAPPTVTSGFVVLEWLAFV